MINLGKYSKYVYVNKCTCEIDIFQSTLGKIERLEQSSVSYLMGESRLLFPLHWG